MNQRESLQHRSTQIPPLAKGGKGGFDSFFDPINFSISIICRSAGAYIVDLIGFYKYFAPSELSNHNFTHKFYMRLSSINFLILSIGCARIQSQFNYITNITKVSENNNCRQRCILYVSTFYSNL